MEDENKHSLESIKYCEEIRHHNSPLIDEQQAKRPREAKETQESKCTQDPGSVKED